MVSESYKLVQYLSQSENEQQSQHTEIILFLPMMQECQQFKTQSVQEQDIQKFSGSKVSALIGLKEK